MTCQNKGYWNPGAKIDEAIVDYNCDDTKIMQLIYQYGSAVIGLYAGDHGWENYVSGVFDTCRYYCYSICMCQNVYFNINSA